jgi:hypothetical protein
MPDETIPRRATYEDWGLHPRRLPAAAFAKAGPLRVTLPVPGLAVRPEATMRLGRILARLREDKRALSLLNEVPRLTTEADLLYLSNLFSGEIHERARRVEHAIDSYRAAAIAVPSGRTASLMLAPLLMDRGLRQEAADLANAAIVSPIEADPWLNYTKSGLRHWPTRIARVRQLLSVKTSLTLRPDR